MRQAASLLAMALLSITRGFPASETSLLSEFTIRRWSIEDGMPESAVVGIEQRADGYLSCATPQHLLRFDGVEFISITGNPPTAPTAPPMTTLPPGVSPRDVTAAVKDGTDTTWIGTARGLYRWQGRRWASLTARDGVFPWDTRCLELDREGNVWVGTSGGLVRLRRRTVTVFHTGLALANESITALFAESLTNFWVGVAGGGLLSGPPDALKPISVGTMAPDTTISALCRDRDGTMWIGTQGDYLWKWSPDGRVSQVREAAGSKISAQGISALLLDRHGRLWVGTWEGLMRLKEKAALTPVPVRTSGAPKPILAKDAVHVLCEDQTGRLWVGYQRAGLLRIQDKGGAEQFQEDVGVLSGSLFSLHPAADGTLWIGTSNGLGRWRGDECRQFTTANGLPHNVVLQILEDASGDLWLGTRQGLMRIRKAEFDEIAAGRKTVVAARHFGLEAGMASAECTGRFGARAAKTSDGRLWFPTMEGIASVNPQRISPQRPAPAARVEDVRLGGEKMPATSRIRLPLGRRDAEFRFTAPSLTAPERTHFKYQLAGHDSAWSRATAERTATYSALDPGTYRFHVMARDRDSDWGKPSDPVELIVPPYFWESAAFWILVATLAATGAALAARHYYRSQAARQVDLIERRHALERERERIARDIHDDVGAGLTEVAMLSELAREDGTRPNELQRHLDAIFRRARELTQSLDEIVWAINPANDTLESLLSYIGESAQAFLSAAGVACRLEFPREPRPLPISSTIRHHLCLAIKEALHNVVKHAQATEARVSVSIANRELSVAISDDGRGFGPDDRPGTGCGRDGISNLHARLAAIGGRFRQTNGPKNDTIIVLSVDLPTCPAAEDRSG